MAVAIRLQRFGRKKSPFYRIVAANSKCARDGKYIELLGFYNPVARGAAPKLDINLEKLEKRLDHGAKPSATVAGLIKTFKKQNAAK